MSENIYIKFHFYVHNKQAAFMDLSSIIYFRNYFKGVRKKVIRFSLFALCPGEHEETIIY